MLTLKLKWQRYEEGKMVDETTLFIPADRVAVHGEIASLEKMIAWPPGSFMDYSVTNDHTNEIMPSRLIEVVKDEHSVWYLAAQAWVLGPNGQTIERIAP